MSEINLTIEGVDPVELLGQKNVKLNLLRKAFPDVKITSRGNNIKLSGEKKFTQKAKSKFEQMVRWLKEHNELSVQTVEDLLNGENLFAHRLSSNGIHNKTLVHGRGAKSSKPKPAIKKS